MLDGLRSPGESPAFVIVGPSVRGEGESSLRRAFRYSVGLINYFIETVVILALLVQLTVLFADVVLRLAFKYYIGWTVDISQLNMAIIAFGGAVIASRRMQHVALTAMFDRLPSALQPWVAATRDILTIGALAVVVVFSVPLLIQSWTQYSTALQWRETWFLLPLTLGLSLVTVHTVWRIARRSIRQILLSLLVVAVLVGGGLLAETMLGALTGSWGAIVVQLGVFVLLLVSGMPIAFALIAASVVYLAVSGIATPVAAVINMNQGLNDFLLLAIPLFVLAGLLMGVGGLSKRLADCLRRWVGRMRGGLLQVVVVACFVFSGLSGAKIADVVAVGVPLKGALEREGYDRSETGAVLAASAAAGETIPPSIAMLVLGSVTSVSIAGLFVAGIVPAACITVGIMLLVYVRARRQGIRGATGGSVGDTLRATWAAAPAFAIPLVIVGGIVTGVATPTEVSSIAVVIGLVFAGIVYRELGWRRLRALLVDTAAMSGMILLLVSAASAFSWSLTAANLPSEIAATLSGFQGSTVLFFLASLVVLLAMGSLLEGLPAIIIFAPLLVPAATNLGINPLQYGIVLIVAMGIGAFSPPLGAGIYVVSSIIGARVEDVSRRVLPYTLVLIAVAVLIVLIPGLSLALPDLFHIGH